MTTFENVFKRVCRRDILILKDDYKEVKEEIISFINSKAENYEVIKKGEIEGLTHFKELPCSLVEVLECDTDIAEYFKAYVWALIQSGDIIVFGWDSFDEIVESEICYLTSE